MYIDILGGEFPMFGHTRPIICPPKHVVRDCFIPRVVPYIHPIVRINRFNIVNVPRHIYRPITRNVIVDPGYPSKCC